MSIGITFQQGVQPTAEYSGCEDAHLALAQTARNYGVTTHVTMQPGWLKGLMSFDVSRIPEGATDVSASLFFYFWEGAGVAQTVYAHKGLVSWIEGTKDNVTAGAGEPCWNAREADGAGGVTTPWGAAGGLAGTDYATTAENNVICTANGAWYEIDISTMVAAWIATPAVNFGLWLLATGTAGIALRMRSSEYATAANRPYLSVVYTLPPTQVYGILGPGGVLNGAPLQIRTTKGDSTALLLIPGAPLAAKAAVGDLAAGVVLPGAPLSVRAASGDFAAEVSETGSSASVKSGSGYLAPLLGTDGAAVSTHYGAGVLNALTLLRGDGAYVEGEGGEPELPMFEVVPSKRIVIFQGWGAEGVPLAHFQAAKAAVRCNVACIFGDYDNGGLALSIARATGLGLEVVVQASPFCLTAIAQPQPDLDDLATACAAWKEAGVAAVILVHESPGCNNPCATTYLTAAKAACQAAGLYGIGIVDDPTSGNQAIPRSVGLSIWVEVRGEVWTLPGPTQIWGGTVENIQTHVRGRIAKLEDTETPGEWDLVLWQIGGIDPAVWETLTDEQKDWAWRVLVEWQFAVMLEELSRRVGIGLVLWIEETFTDVSAREWIGLEGQAAYAAAIAAWWGARMVSASLGYLLRMTASLEPRQIGATLEHSSLSASLTLEGPTGGA